MECLYEALVKKEFISRPPKTDILYLVLKMLKFINLIYKMLHLSYACKISG